MREARRLRAVRGAPGQRGGAGHPGLLAPEQAALAPPSVRWDIYALGATGHFMLTGDIPRLTAEGRTTRTPRSDCGGAVATWTPTWWPWWRPASRRTRTGAPPARRRSPRTGTAATRSCAAVRGVWVTALASRLMSERGLVASRGGRFDEAQLWWAEALRLTPQDAGLRRLLAEYPFRLAKMFRTGADSGEFTVEGELVTEPSRVPKGEPTKPMRFGRDWSGPREVGDARFPTARPLWRGERNGQLGNAEGKRGPRLPVKLGGKPELCFAVSRDGKQVATMDPMGRVQVWDPRTGAALSPVMLCTTGPRGCSSPPTASCWRRLS